MQKRIQIHLLPSESGDDNAIRQYAAALTGASVSSITGWRVLKRSVDGRGKKVVVALSIVVFIEEPFTETKMTSLSFMDVFRAKRKVVIVGAGPAGLFAALQLINCGIRPILLERGKDVRSRRRDLAILNKSGVINPESNYCFGEGGAGTYSDGKLFTRSDKRGNVGQVLGVFVQFGADNKILYDSHPHIGTNKLPGIVSAIRRQILDCGGEFLFDKRVTDFAVANGRIDGVGTADGNWYFGDAVILATGHSARDIFRLLHRKNLQIIPKPFALGVRVEHPQTLIDHIQYHCSIKEENLPPASYTLAGQFNNKGVFSFCMCPGGIIAPASTCPDELVVNGWSPSKRNNPYANSGIVVGVEPSDAHQYLRENYNHYDDDNSLLMVDFQQLIEQNAFAAGGGRFVAPAQRLVDFTNHIDSTSLPDCSYIPGVLSRDLNEILPPYIAECLALAFKAFGKRMKGFFTNEAIVLAVESRTSSPVRIPRDVERLCHPQIDNFYPCGEGAGYAGGIMSAAMDGRRVALCVANSLNIRVI